MGRHFRTDSCTCRAALFVAATLFYWVGNDRVSFWDRDEPRYAETARQMRLRGDYIVPYFNDQFRFQKPPMTYWLVAASYSVFGENEFAARAVSGLCLAAALVVIAGLGDRMFGAPAGLLAALMFCVTPMACILGKLAIPDGPQLLAAVVCLAAMYGCWRQGAEPRKATRWAIAFWIALASSILIKGPILIGMIALAFASLWLLTRTRPSDFALGWKSGPLLALLLTLPWLAAIYAAAGPAFFSESVGNQIARRLGESFDRRFLPPSYYAVTALACLAPWTGFVLFSLVDKPRRFLRRTPEAFLLAWSVGPMILLELFRSKQPHYFAPSYPALMLLAAGSLAPMLRGECSLPTTWRWNALRWWFAGAALMTAVGAAYFGIRLDAGFAWAVVAAVVFGSTGAMAYRLFVRRRLQPALVAQGFGFAAAVLVMTGAVLPAMEDSRVAKPLAERLANESRSELLVFGCIEPSFTYYSKRAVVELVDRPNRARPIQTGEEDLVVATTASQLAALEKLVGRPALVEATYSGWLRMHKDEVVLARFPPTAAANEAETTKR